MWNCFKLHIYIYIYIYTHQHVMCMHACSSVKYVYGNLFEIKMKHHLKKNELENTK
jgi:hypothetical protein